MSKYDGMGEQICKRWIKYGRGVSRWEKRQTHKKWRRLRKLLGQNAPTKLRFSGWSD